VLEIFRSAEEGSPLRPWAAGHQRRGRAVGVDGAEIADGRVTGAGAGDGSGKAGGGRRTNVQ